jgi:hypothetical protein
LLLLASQYRAGEGGRNCCIDAAAQQMAPIATGTVFGN